jgi:hypothetical protein
MRRARDRGASRRRRRAMAAAVIGCTTAVSIGLRLNSPALIQPQASFDDSMFTYQGWMIATDRWLGPYMFATLAKGPGYPLFIAGVYQLDLPLKLSEHVLHLLAVGVLALAVARLTRQRGLAIVLYCALALDPSYFGASSSTFSRDNYYSSLSLLLVAAVILVVGEVPRLVRGRAVVAVPLLVTGGVAIGAVAGLYYMTREERVWLAPTLVLALVVAVVTWRRRRASLLLAGATALVVAVACTTSWWSVDDVRDRNEANYGSRIIGELAEGEGARAYAEWQRIDLGPVLHWVTINTEQRHAAYTVSPAAAELEPHLEGWGTRWMGPGCNPPLPHGCEYPGSFFVWVLREATWQVGRGDTAAEAQAFLGRLADEIRAACDDGRLPCTAPGIAAMPPWSRVDTAQLWPSAHRLTTYLFAFDAAEPGPARVSGGTAERWEEMLRALRGIDATQAEWDRMARAAAGRQWPVALLTDVYRWMARLGVVPALAGITLGLSTRAARRRHGHAALLGIVFLSGAASRIVALTVVDATAFDTRLGIYLLPAAAFLVAFLVTGWCVLARVVLDRSPAGGDVMPPSSETVEDADPTGPTEQGQAAAPGFRSLDVPASTSSAPPSG